MATKKTKRATVKEACFYLYKWSNGFTTFVVASSPEEALEKIRRSREAACPPEVGGERLSKKRLSATNPDFILTVSSAQSDDEEFIGDDLAETPTKRDLN